jgi:PPOX class probable F420-dependent enzyme
MPRRDQIRLDDAEIREFLESSRTIILTSNGPGGYPHSMPMWFQAEPDGAIRMTTYGRSQKVQNLRRDPRVSLLVESGFDYTELKGVLFYGRAEIIDDVERILDVLTAADPSRSDGGDAEQQRAIREGMRRNAAKRVLIRVKPDRVVSWDHSKLGGVY